MNIFGSTLDLGASTVCLSSERFWEGRKDVGAVSTQGKTSWAGPCLKVS